MAPHHEETAIRYFKLRNSSGNIIYRMVMDSGGNNEVWSNPDNKVQANDAKWTDLVNETDGKIKQGEWYKLGAHVVGPMPNEWDGGRLWKVDPNSNKQATYTYTTGGVSLDGITDRNE